jgi:hypothetical protein
MTTFLIEYKNKIIGSYQDYEMAETFILSCLQNNLMTTSAKILKFKTNSCYYDNEYVITLPNASFSESSKVVNFIPDPVFIPATQVIPSENLDLVKHITKKDIDMDDPKVKELAKERIDLQHKINLLKVHKQRIEENKKVYENDLNLFNVFSENIKNDKNFVIPELFVDKFNIIKKLKNDGKLSLENFSNLHKKENYYGDYFGTNDYEEYFYDNTKSDDIEEELDIESESDTATSDNE